MGALTKHDVQMPNQISPHVTRRISTQKEYRNNERNTKMTQYLREGEISVEHSNPSDISLLLVKGKVPMQDEGPSIRDSNMRRRIDPPQNSIGSDMQLKSNSVGFNLSENVQAKGTNNTSELSGIIDKQRHLHTDSDDMIPT